MSVKSNIGVVTDGLVFYVDAANKQSYSGSGTVVSELTGNYADGALVNGTSYITSNGGAFSFDRVDDHITTDISDIWDLMTSEWTLSYWIKASGGDWAHMIGNASGNTGDTDFFSELFLLTTNYNNTVPTSGNSRILMRDAGPSRNGSGLTLYRFTWTDNHNDGNWHNIVITHRNSDASQEVYVDGSSTTVTVDPSNSVVPNPAYVENPAERNPFIGAAHNRDNTIANPFGGQLACVSFYNRKLTSAEALQNYNALKNRFI